MSRRLLLLMLGAASDLALLCAGCDDFEMGARARRHIVINDDPSGGSNSGGVNNGGSKSDRSVAPRYDGGATPPPVNSGPCGNDFESKVFALVNQERSAAGKALFKCDSATVKVAHDYSQLQCDQRQMGHNVGGTSPFQRMQAGGISYRTAGENIAAGQQTPEQVMESWMNSSGRKANILGDYTYIGIGYVPCESGAGGPYWTQDFWG
jgi:uncharacterized protein YkwD